jgi:HD-GYP domain-containing protein (c-di-GMP phosphodiesterase class II)
VLGDGRSTGEVRDLVVSYVPLPPDLVLLHAVDVTERIRALEEARQHLARLSALRRIDMAITTSMDLRLILEVVLAQACTELAVDAAQVLVLNRATLMLEAVANRGFLWQARAPQELPLDQSLAGRAARERSLITITDLRAKDLSRAPVLVGERFVTYAAAPLLAKGEVHGVLEVFHRAPLALTPEWVDFLEALAGQTAIAIDNDRLLGGLQHANDELLLAYEATIEGWSRALDLRDKETEGHSRRVTTMTVRLAQALGVSDAELVHVRRGALLHDIGKMGVPDAILLKPGPLTEEEWAIMRRHPAMARDLLFPIAHLRLALDIPYCHHEKWDGSGYPQGLAGEEIPLAARIFAVVDVYDALTSDRPYRAAWPLQKVRTHLKSLAGSHFDPAVVHAFLALPIARSRRNTRSNYPD